jgi:hypothetical protein
MRYTIKVERPYSVEPQDFTVAVSNYIQSQHQTELAAIEVFETAQERLQTFKDNVGNLSLTRYSYVNILNAIRGFSYKNWDLDPNEDAYFIDIDVPEKEQHFMNQGRGAFLPRILRKNGKPDNADEKSLHRVDRIIAMDYVKRGGR